jgi:hypothetical protein
MNLSSAHECMEIEASKYRHNRLIVEGVDGNFKSKFNTFIRPNQEQ